MGAPVGQAVAPPQVVDGERRARGDVKVGKLPQLLVVLRGRSRELLRLLPNPFLGLSGTTRRMN